MDRPFVLCPFWDVKVKFISKRQAAQWINPMFAFFFDPFRAKIGR
jgi:hypothetical protein